MAPGEAPNALGEVESAFDEDLTLRTPLLVTMAVAAVLAPLYGSTGLFDPWETHYAEVARNMLESGDWISPWWGSDWPSEGVCLAPEDCTDGWICEASRAEFLDRTPACRPADVRPEGRYFFSKPALPFWMMAAGMGGLGVGPWGARLLFVLVGLFGVFELSRAATRLWGDSVGALAGLAMGLSPMYALVSRQALTDGPFVALLTAACARLMTGLWDDDPGRDEPAPRAFRGFATVLGALVVGQALLVAVQLGLFVPVAGGARLPVGPVHALFWIAGTVGLVRSALLVGPTGRRVDLWVAYLLLGLAFLSKGVLALALPGATVLMYGLVARDRSLLRRLELPRGVVTFAVVALPWYAAMFARHHPEFWERFFVHDHFRRFTAGVHSVEAGGFEHYALWLGLAMFPWAMFLPAVVAREAVRPGGSTRTAGPDRARLFCFLWMMITVAVFTLARTKYHHYILPVTPPAAILIALLLDDLAAGRLSRAASALVCATAAGGLAILGFDLTQDPQRVINLATYIYDREWPVDVVLGGELTMLACVSGAALAPLAASCLGRGRAGALPGAMAAAAVVVSGWCVHRYMPAISETWSQRGLFDAYYADCTPTDPPERLYSGRIRCREPLIAYKMYWRGETWHSQNTVIPLRKDSQVDHFMSSEAAQDVYYALTERSRVAHQFRSELPSERQEFMSTVHDGNAKFVLLRIGTAGDRATVDGTASQ